MVWIIVVPLCLLCLWSFFPHKIKTSGKDGALQYVFNGLVSIVLATMGLWNSFLTDSYSISTRAEEFDDDPYDDDNKHEALVSVTGRSVSVSSHDNHLN